MWATGIIPVALFYKKMLGGNYQLLCCKWGERINARAR